MTRIIAALFVTATLVACGAGGEPVKPQVGASTTIGVNSKGGSYTDTSINIHFPAKLIAGISLFFRKTQDGPFPLSRRCASRRRRFVARSRSAGRHAVLRLLHGHTDPPFHAVR